MRKMAIYGLKIRYARSSSIAKVEILYSGIKKPRDSTRLTQENGVSMSEIDYPI